MTGIRIATLDDVATLARFRVALVCEEGAEASDALFEACVSWFASELATASFRAWLAFDGGVPIGTAGYRILPLLPRTGVRPPREARIHNVFVVGAYRNRGIGEALVRELLVEIRAGAFHRVTLGARERARPFYARLGFVPSRDMQLDRAMVEREEHAGAEREEHGAREDGRDHDRHDDADPVDLRRAASGPET